jgi:hypothetical protein
MQSAVINTTNRVLAESNVDARTRLIRQYVASSRWRVQYWRNTPKLEASWEEKQFLKNVDMLATTLKAIREESLLSRYMRQLRGLRIMVASGDIPKYDCIARVQAFSQDTSLPTSIMSGMREAPAVMYYSPDSSIREQQQVQRLEDAVWQYTDENPWVYVHPTVPDVTYWEIDEWDRPMVGKHSNLLWAIDDFISQSIVDEPDYCEMGYTGLTMSGS